MHLPAPRARLALALLLACALAACSSSTFKDADLDRLIEQSRDLNINIINQQDQIQNTLQRTTRFINAVPINPIAGDGPTAAEIAHADLHRVRTILFTCFNQPVRREVGECAVETLLLHLEQDNLDPATAELVRERVERVMTIRHNLKATLPQMIFDLSRMLIQANTLTNRLSSKIDTLNPEDLDLNEKGLIELNDARLLAEQSRSLLGGSLSLVDASLDAVNQELDAALEQMVYNLISFGIPVTLDEDDEKDSQDAPPTNPVVEPAPTGTE